MIECKVVRKNKLRKNKDCWDIYHKTRRYRPVYTLALRIDDGAPIKVRGQNYVTIDEDGNMIVDYDNGKEYGPPSVQEVAYARYAIRSHQDYVEIAYTHGCEADLEKAILDAVWTIDYVDPGE